MLGLHKRAVAAVAAVSIVALLALAASMALMQPATVAPKGGTAEGLGLKGIVNIVVRDASGNVKYEKTYENNIQGAGYLALLKRGFDEDTLANLGTLGADDSKKLAFDYIRICSSEATLDEDTGEITAAPEEITTDVDRGTLSVTISQVTEGSSYKVEVQQSFTVTASGGITIKSIELTDEEDTPTVFSYIDIADISLNQNDSITITWTITVSGN